MNPDYFLLVVPVFLGVAAIIAPALGDPELDAEFQAATPQEPTVPDSRVIRGETVSVTS